MQRGQKILSAFGEALAIPLPAMKTNKHGWLEAFQMLAAVGIKAEAQGGVPGANSQRVEAVQIEKVIVQVLEAFSMRPVIWVGRKLAHIAAI